MQIIRGEGVARRPVYARRDAPKCRLEQFTPAHPASHRHLPPGSHTPFNWHAASLSQRQAAGGAGGGVTAVLLCRIPDTVLVKPCWCFCTAPAPCRWHVLAGHLPLASVCHAHAWRLRRHPR